jgi:hypothetical protein
MNTYQSINRPIRLALAGLATIAAVGAVLADPTAATADRPAPAGGGNVSGSALPDGIEYQILYRKLQVAQDRVDRPWAYR